MTELAKAYGDGLYDLAAEEGIASELLDQLRELKSCFRQQPDFCRLLSNMALSKQERLGILDSALRGAIHPYLLNFLKILCQRGALYEFEGCEAAFRALYNQANGILEAAVTTSIPLTESRRRELAQKLSQMTGRQVALTERVDPGVIGGVMLEMDGKRYDNTLRHRLEAIRRAMAGEA